MACSVTFGQRYCTWCLENIQWVVAMDGMTFDDACLCFIFIEWYQANILMLEPSSDSWYWWSNGLSRDIFTALFVHDVSRIYGEWRPWMGRHLMMHVCVSSSLNDVKLTFWCLNHLQTPDIGGAMACPVTPGRPYLNTMSREYTVSGGHGRDDRWWCMSVFHLHWMITS